MWFICCIYLGRGWVAGVRLLFNEHGTPTKQLTNRRPDWLTNPLEIEFLRFWHEWDGWLDGPTNQRADAYRNVEEKRSKKSSGTLKIWLGFRLFNEGAKVVPSFEMGTVRVLTRELTFCQARSLGAKKKQKTWYSYALKGTKWSLFRMRKL